MSVTLQKGELTFTTNEVGDYFCNELKNLPELFEEAHDHDEVEKAISEHLLVLAGSYLLGSAKDREEYTLPENIEKAKQIFMAEAEKARQEIAGLSMFQRFLFWLSYWHYYNQNIRTNLNMGDWHEMQKNVAVLVKTYILPILPLQARKEVESMEATNVAVNYGHFAILYCQRTSGSNNVRRIVTDTQLFEIREVYGYQYIDVAPDGKPFIRCCTDRAGQRAFFDGNRLMSHSQFETCAPKPTFTEQGYKVNSTRCSVVNGSLYPLLDTDDKVAQTDGAFWGMCGFSKKDALASYKMGEESAKQLQVDGQTITLNGQTYEPHGTFMRSHMKLLKSGFTLVNWSDYHAIPRFAYKSVTVVDDNKEWIEKVKKEFEPFLDRFTFIHTEDKRAALKQVLVTEPEAILLDVHLTASEEFDGLWIANQLASFEFKGRIALASSYGEESLIAMSKLIKVRVAIPGKNLENIRSLLIQSI